MPPLPRGRCPDCGAEVALRKGGLVREHYRAAGPVGSAKPARKYVCSGSGKLAKPKGAR